MSTVELTIDSAPVAIGDWKELSSRVGDGLEIALLWSPSADRVKVVVLDEKLGEAFELHVPGADALGAFYHPFSYAAGLGFSDLMCGSLDPQAQN